VFLRDRFLLVALLVSMLCFWVLQRSSGAADSIESLFSAELLATTIALTCWLVSLLAQPYLAAPTRLFAGMPTQITPSSAGVVLSGIALGGSLALLLIAAAVTFLFATVGPGDLAGLAWLSVPSLSWLHSLRMLLVILLLGRWFRRPAILFFSCILLGLDFSPGLQSLRASSVLAGAAFFPVSLAALDSDVLSMTGVLGRGLFAASLHDLGLWAILLLLGSREPRP
jgi:hypothetical protein